MPLDGLSRHRGKQSGVINIGTRSFDAMIARPTRTLPDFEPELHGVGVDRRAAERHPNGAYVARNFLETFGRDSQVATVPSPFAFIRIFRAAPAKRGDTPAFSPAGIAALDAMERRYTAPAPSRRSRDGLTFLNSARSDDRSSVHERRRMVWDARLP
jgi:hypothetical protein